MKRLAVLAAMTALVLAGCNKEEKIYTEDELGVIIEWVRCGWDEVKNETGGTVTLITSYPFGSHEDVTSVLAPGEMVKLDIGAAAPGVSIGESSQAIIRLDDGTEIVCVHDKEMTPWAERLYTNFQQEHTYEVIDFDGKKLRHNLVIQSYHIDQTLIDLWTSPVENK